MNDRPRTFLQIILTMTEAMENETYLARTGALDGLAAAATRKQAAFAEFRLACQARDPAEPSSEGEREALLALLRAGDESALVLDAVKMTLGQFVTRLRAAVGALTDPGVYAPLAGQTGRVRHIRAIRLNASV